MVAENVQGELWSTAVSLLAHRQGLGAHNRWEATVRTRQSAVETPSEILPTQTEEAQERIHNRAWPVS